MDNAISVQDEFSILYIGMSLNLRDLLDYIGISSFQLLMQKDGNLVIIRQSGKKAIWATGRNQNGGYVAIMQQDGNFVVYKSDEKTPVWATGTQGRGFLYLKMQGDGNLVLYSISGNYPVWASGTHGNMKVAMNLRIRSSNSTSTPVVNLGPTPAQEILLHSSVDNVHFESNNVANNARGAAIGVTDQAFNRALDGIN